MVIKRYGKTILAEDADPLAEKEGERGVGVWALCKGGRVMRQGALIGGR